MFSSRTRARVLATYFENKSLALEGPFHSFDTLCDAIQLEMRKIFGLENFVLDRSLVIASPQFSVEEQDRILNSASAVDVDVAMSETGIPEVKVRILVFAQQANGELNHVGHVRRQLEHQLIKVFPCSIHVEAPSQKTAYIGIKNIF